MRSTYEAYVLVKIKDGSQFVCALNRPAKRKGAQQMSKKEQEEFLATQVIWN